MGHEVAVAAVVKAFGTWVFSTASIVAAWILAQADSLVDLIPQGTAAGLILVTAAFLLRWTYRTAQEAEARYIGVIAALEADNQRLEEDLREARADVDRWRGMYETEYRLRVRIETGGRPVAGEPGDGPQEPV